MTRVNEAIPRRVEDRHQRLQHKAEGERAVNSPDELGPEAVHQIVHVHLSSGAWFLGYWVVSPIAAESISMWFDLDPELRRQLDNLRRMVALQRQTPTREWPMITIEDNHALLVVREWPDGSITAYLASVGD